jgi:MULE transposase domain
MRQLVAMICAGETDTSVASALLELAGDTNNIGLIFARDPHGNCVVLPLDAEQIAEIAEHEAHTIDAAGSRESRSQRRTEVRLSHADAEQAESSYVQLHRKMMSAMRGQSKAQHDWLRRESHGSAASNPGSGNHGADLTNHWNKFLFSGAVHEILAFAWADVRTAQEVYRYPEVLQFDTTFLTSKQQLPLFDVVGFNGNHKTLVVMRAFMVDETMVLHDFAINTALPFLYGSDFCQSVCLGLLDGDVGEFVILDQAAKYGLFHNMKLRRCSFHDVTQRFDKVRVGESGTTTHTVKQSVLSLLWACVDSRSSGETLGLLSVATALVREVQNETTFVDGMLGQLSLLAFRHDLWAGCVLSFSEGVCL